MQGRGGVIKGWVAGDEMGRGVCEKELDYVIECVGVYVGRQAVV